MDSRKKKKKDANYRYISYTIFREKGKIASVKNYSLA
jgi:hypothetical protein